MSQTQKGAFPWKIQKIVKKGNYLYAKVPEHPNSTKNGYVLEHRIIVENTLKRLLDPKEIERKNKESGGCHIGEPRK